MEQFKVINIPTNTEEPQEEEIENSYDDGDYTPPKRVHKILFVIAAILIICGVIYINYATYDEYEVTMSVERIDSSETKYVQFKDNLLKYSSDGVSYTTFRGALIWNYTYDMTNPVADICDGYAVVYDKKGNSIVIFSETGLVNSVTTVTPIIEVRVAKNGIISILSQEGSTSTFTIQGPDDKVYVYGELHPQNSGYPVATALSSDGKKLMISLIDVNDGDIKSTVAFYDFSNRGEQEIGEEAANYCYFDILIPRVEFMDNDRAIAFGDNEIIIYNNNENFSVEKEVFVNSPIKSIFYNDKYFGYITDKVLETGEITNCMVLYYIHGIKCFEKEFDNSYKDIYITSNNEVVMNDDSNVYIYNKLGVRKFAYEFERSVKKVFPSVTSHKYLLIEDNETKEIHIK